MSPNTALYAPHARMRVLTAPSTCSSSSNDSDSRPNSSTRSSSDCRNCSNCSSLSAECETLKRKIRLEHPEKLTRFSLSHMRRVAIPPVTIPPTFTLAPTVVSGKSVLFTRSSWMRRKRDRRLLRRIRENDVLWA